MNCNSLILDNRYALLSNLLNYHDQEVLCLCETNIDPSISNSATFPPDSVYSLVNRKDHKLGSGGILIAVKDTILALLVTDLDSECEIVWIRVEIAKGKPLFVGLLLQRTLKRRPMAEVLNNLHESVSKLTSSDTVLPNMILNGDFNTQTLCGIITD